MIQSAASRKQAQCQRETGGSARMVTSREGELIAAFARGDQLAAAVALADGQHLNILADDGAWEQEAGVLIEGVLGTPLVHGLRQEGGREPVQTVADKRPDCPAAPTHAPHRPPEARRAAPSRPTARSAHSGDERPHHHTHTFIHHELHARSGPQQPLCGVNIVRVGTLRGRAEETPPRAATLLAISRSWAHGLR